MFGTLLKSFKSTTESKGVIFFIYFENLLCFKTIFVTLLDKVLVDKVTLGKVTIDKVAVDIVT